MDNGYKFLFKNDQVDQIIENRDSHSNQLSPMFEQES